LGAERKRRPPFAKIFTSVSNLQFDMPTSYSNEMQESTISGRVT
jgi:hypothetical protein